MLDVSDTVLGLRNEADIDFLSLPLIAGAVQCDLGLESQQEIRHYTLEVIRKLMARGVCPGDYTLEDLTQGRGFQFWSGTPDDLLGRIEAEWIALGRVPNLEHSICWFALRSP